MNLKILVQQFHILEMKLILVVNNYISRPFRSPCMHYAAALINSNLFSGSPEDGFRGVSEGRGRPHEAAAAAGGAGPRLRHRTQQGGGSLTQDDLNSFLRRVTLTTPQKGACAHLCI